MGNIISLFSRGNSSDSFEALLARHVKALYRQAYQYTGNASDAEDLLQDLFLELYAKRQQLGNATNLPAWLNRCLYHRFIDRYRRLQRVPQFDDVDEECVCKRLAAHEVVEEDCFHQQVLQGLEQLTAVQRAVISLHDLSGFSLPELVEIMDIPLGTLKSHLHRARKRLKKSLDLQPYVLEQRQFN